MKKSLPIIILFILFILFTGLNGQDSPQEVRKTFSQKKAVRLKTFSGNCIVTVTEEKNVSVRFIHTYSNITFEPVFEEEGSTLVLKEKFHIAESGNSTWYLSIPAGVALEYSSISGDFSIRGLKANIDVVTVSGDIKANNCNGIIGLKTTNGDLTAERLSGTLSIRGAASDLKLIDLSGTIDIKTGSGDVEAEKLSGQIMLKSPSGDVRIKDSRGVFNIKTASGEIHATNILFNDVSQFKTTSGDVYISLVKTLAHDLNIETASGDVTLNYNGNPVEGFFQFRANARSGEMIAPYAFEYESEDEKWGKKYVIKSFQREFKIPKITLSTTSGTLKLKEK